MMRNLLVLDIGVEQHVISTAAMNIGNLHNDDVGNVVLIVVIMSRSMNRRAWCCLYPLVGLIMDTSVRSTPGESWPSTYRWTHVFAWCVEFIRTICSYREPPFGAVLG
jgi:hypothetical protein